MNENRHAVPESARRARSSTDLGNVQLDEQQKSVDGGTTSPPEGQTETASTDDAKARKRPAQDDGDSANALEGLDAMKAKLLATKSRRSKKKKKT